MRYFVLVTEKEFGVFLIEATHYPQEFLNNMDSVRCVSLSELDRYLLEKVGRNRLNNSRFNLYTSIGQLYSR